MDTLALIAALLETLANATPSLGSGQSPLAGMLNNILSTASALIKAGDAGAGELAALSLHIQNMVSSGADPTEDDWNALKTRSDAAHALIQAGSSSSAGSPSSPPSSGPTGSTESPP